MPEKQTRRRAPRATQAGRVRTTRARASSRQTTEHVRDGKHGARSGRSGSLRSRKWSQQVAERSDALDLQRGVFTRESPRAIARSLKRSAERSRRRKASPFQSAMSMLNFYINRAGRTLPATQRRVLERAKHELRIAFGKA